MAEINYPAFSEVRVCAKCGCEHTYLKWSREMKLLEVHCQRCAFAWYMLGKDETETPNNESEVLP